jgi:hypothetical protein
MSASCCRLRDCNCYTAAADPTCYIITEYAFKRIKKPPNSLSSRKTNFFFHYFTPESPALTTATKKKSSICLRDHQLSIIWAACLRDRRPSITWAACLRDCRPSIIWAACLRDCRPSISRYTRCRPGAAQAAYKNADWLLHELPLRAANRFLHAECCVAIIQECQPLPTCWMLRCCYTRMPANYCISCCCRQLTNPYAEPAKLTAWKW